MVSVRQQRDPFFFVTAVHIMSLLDCWPVLLKQELSGYWPLPEYSGLDPVIISWAFPWHLDHICHLDRHANTFTIGPTTCSLDYQLYRKLSSCPLIHTKYYSYLGQQMAPLPKRLPILYYYDFQNLSSSFQQEETALMPVANNSAHLLCNPCRLSVVYLFRSNGTDIEKEGVVFPTVLCKEGLLRSMLWGFKHIHRALNRRVRLFYLIGVN